MDASKTVIEKSVPDTLTILSVKPLLNPYPFIFKINESLFSNAHYKEDIIGSILFI